MEKTEIPVRFSIPDGLPDSDDSNPKDKIHWELKAESGTGWLRYNESKEGGDARKLTGSRRKNCAA